MMASSKLSELHSKLSIATMILDSAAADIADAEVQDSHELIRSIGESLVKVYEVQRALEEHAPELRRIEETIDTELSEANQRLTRALADALDSVHSGDPTVAVGMLERYLKEESSVLHREIAKGELQRILGHNQ